MRKIIPFSSQTYKGKDKMPPFTYVYDKKGNRIAFVEVKEHAEYIVIACNAYPVLIEALEVFAKEPNHDGDPLTFIKRGQEYAKIMLAKAAIAQAKAE